MGDRVRIDTMWRNSDLGKGRPQIAIGNLLFTLNTTHYFRVYYIPLCLNRKVH